MPSLPPWNTKALPLLTNFSPAYSCTEASTLRVQAHTTQNNAVINSNHDIDGAVECACIGPERETESYREGGGSATRFESSSKTQEL